MVGEILFTISFVCLIYCGFTQVIKYKKTRTFTYKDKAVNSMFLGMMIMLLNSALVEDNDVLYITITIIGAFFTFVVPIIYLFKVAFRKSE